MNARNFRLASDWLAAAESRHAGLRSALLRIYGSSADAPLRRIERIRALAERYVAQFGDGPVVLSRAPGRVNLMGRHIDHQGGHCNMLAIEHDLYVMAGKRDDARLWLANLDSDRFPAYMAEINGVLPGYCGGDWRAYVDSPPVAEQAARDAGQWQQYVKAALARLLSLYPDRGWRGMNLVVDGDIPVAAGLSSSSALVVAVAEAIVALFDITMGAECFAEMCGEAEWYVGARGGAGDQAAMKFARAGQVVQLSFHPLELVQVAPWPEQYALLVFNSGILARKSAGARNTFNQRVACYHIAREVVKRRMPALAERVKHLRDLAPNRLGVPDARVAEMLLSVPEALTRSEIMALLGSDVAEPLLASHTWDDGVYRLRSVALFGIAECERSRRCAELLADGATSEVGRMMNTSHDGDRVSGGVCGAFGPDGKTYPDGVIRELAARCANGVRLADEPGAYACSTAEIDGMVDTCLSVPGVLGAQLSGAGLGGCMMVLAEERAVQDIVSAMEMAYYAPKGLPVSALVCRPVEGSGTIELP